MSFTRTTAINRISDLADTKRKLVIQGGSSAGKTYAILAYLIHLATTKAGVDISVVSESIPHLRRGCIKDFLRIMQWTGRYRDEAWNRSLLTYSFANGSFIEFFSADQETKLRGGRRRVLYVNEANSITFEAFHQLSIRTSGKQFIDFNPSAEFWAHTELVGQEDVGFIVLNYKHNEALPDTIVKDIEAARERAKTSEYWANWWRVYGLGEVGSLQGVVFSNWTQISELPKEAKRDWVAIDFGFTNDPTAIVAGYRYNGQRIYDELAYSTGLFNTDIVQALTDAGVGRTERIFADAADPKSIAEMNRMGWAVKGSTKGADSIRHGIDLMQREPFLVTARSLNFIKELRGYVWDTDRSGATLNVPAGGKDHAIDAARYGELSSEAVGTVTVRKRW